MTAALLAGSVLGCLATVGAQAACLKANADGQVAEGRLVTGRFKDAAGRREDAYILELSAPACLDGADEDDKVNATKRIHVYPHDARLGATMRRLVGKAVRVKGSPFGQHTAHHHAPIVMEIAEIAPR
jgi:Domain of unknown function (DUF4431)